MNLPVDGRMIVAALHSGRATWTTRAGAVSVEAGDIVVLAPGERAIARADTDVDGIVVWLSPAFIADVLLWANPETPGPMSWAGSRRRAFQRIGPDAGRGHAQLMRTMERLQRAAVDRPLKGMAEAVRMLERIERIAVSSEGMLDATTRREVARACELIGASLARPMSVPAIAESVGLSESALTRAFRAGLDTTPAAYSREVRLDRFLELLLHEPISIAEAARACGWSSPSSVRALMLARYGVSPAQFRRRQLLERDRIGGAVAA